MQERLFDPARACRRPLPSIDHRWGIPGRTVLPAGQQRRGSHLFAYWETHCERCGDLVAVQCIDHVSTCPVVANRQRMCSCPTVCPYCCTVCEEW